ncbi:MAG TPA: hypothetical protein VKR61_00165 [Bryobacteraceae bacterium]|nr:hypothetical protein [Bryobacteraceae bacterium]
MCAADPELLSLAPPDSQVMAGVNVEQVMLSPLGQHLLMQAEQQSDSGLQKLIDTTGFDPRHDLREILVVGRPADSSGIVLARGTFNVPRIMQAALANKGTVESYKGVQIVKGSSQEKQVIAFPDSTLAIMGEAADVHAAIDRKSAPTAVSAALAVQVNLASTTGDAWFVSMVPPAQLQPKQNGNAGAQNQGLNPLAMLQNVQQLNGNVKFGAYVVVTVKAISPTAQDASVLSDQLKGLLGMAAMAAGKEQATTPAVALLQKLNISSDGTTTTASLSIPEQQIEGMMKMSGPAAVTPPAHGRRR